MLPSFLKVVSEKTASAVFFTAELCASMDMLQSMLKRMMDILLVMIIIRIFITFFLPVCQQFFGIADGSLGDVVA